FVRFIIFINGEQVMTVESAPIEDPTGEQSAYASITIGKRMNRYQTMMSDTANEDGIFEFSPGFHRVDPIKKFARQGPGLRWSWWKINGVDFGIDHSIGDRFVAAAFFRRENALH